MKKLTKQYLNAVGNSALNKEKTRLILKELIETKDEYIHDYEENQYIVGFEFVKKDDVSAWIVSYIIPAPTEYEIEQMTKIAESKIPNLDSNNPKATVRFAFEENVFEVDFIRNLDGNIEQGYFMPYFFD